MNLPHTMLSIAFIIVTASLIPQEQTKPTFVFSNKDVIDMVKAGFGSEIINAKIVGTDAAFDTSPVALKELKDAGVPQDVILTIVKNPLGLKSIVQQKPQANAVASSAATEPEYGTIQDIKGLAKIFVRADDDDARSTIIRMLSGYEGVGVVNAAKDAEIILDYTILTRDVAANRGPYAHGASMALKSQMRAYTTKSDGTKLIAWTETETFDVTNGFVLGASNEVNLTHHFVRDLQKARGEKTYSMRKLFQNHPKQEKEKNAPSPAP